MNQSNEPAEKAKFYNLSLNVFDRHELRKSIDGRLRGREKISVNFLNAHCFNVAQKDANYRRALSNSTYLLNDGVGIDIAGKLIGVNFKDNLNGTDLIPELLKYFSGMGMSVFFFGARDGVIDAAVDRIRERIPNLTIAGFRHGYFDDPIEVVDQINASGADVVVLGLGVPLQEIWVDSYSCLTENARVFISGGAIFDFLSGNVARAPLFWRRIKLEWLFRLFQEPRRLFSRYVLGSGIFLYHLISLR